MDTTADGDFVPPPLTAEEEDALAHTRILSDERALRKVVRKFYSYAFATEPGSTARGPDDLEISLEEAREGLLAEIATFQMTLQKGSLTCQAEARQVLEYEKEKERIAKEQEATRQQIEELRVTLDEEQKFRARKQEYDKIAEKINTLPSRAELEASIVSTNEEITATQEERYHKDRMMHARKIALDQIVSSLEVLRQMDKDPEVVATPAEAQATDGIVEEDGRRTEDGEEQEEREEREDARLDRERDRAARDHEEEGEEMEGHRSGTPLNLNPVAKPFLPRGTMERLREREGLTPSSSQAPSVAPSPRPPKPEEEEGEEPEDVEMGEVSEMISSKSEKQQSNGRPVESHTEELEEGEASEGGSFQAGSPGN